MIDRIKKLSEHDAVSNVTLQCGIFEGIMAEFPRLQCPICQNTQMIFQHQKDTQSMPVKCYKCAWEGVGKDATYYDVTEEATWELSVKFIDGHRRSFRCNFLDKLLNRVEEDIKNLQEAF